MTCAWRVVAISFALGSLLADPAGAQESERPPVVVTDAGGKSFRIAVQQFAPGAREIDVATLRSGHPGRARVLRPVRVGRSRGVPRAAPDAALSAIRSACPEWRQIGADAFLEGVTRSGGSVAEIEFRVWDVARCRALLTRS